MLNQLYVVALSCIPNLPISRCHPKILLAMGNMIVNTVHNDLNKENLQELLWTYGFSTTSQGKPLMVVDGVYQTVVYESPRQVCYTCGRVGIAVFFVHQKLLLAKEIPMVRRRQAHIRIKFRRWNHHTAIVLQMTVVSTVLGYMLSLIHTVSKEEMLVLLLKV